MSLTNRVKTVMATASEYASHSRGRAVLLNGIADVLDKGSVSLLAILPFEDHRSKNLNEYALPPSLLKDENTIALRADKRVLMKKLVYRVKPHLGKLLN